MPTSLGRYETLPAADRVPVAVTADGGVRLVNPSPHGGTWAFVHTNAAGEPLVRARGVVLVREVVPLTTVTNNFTEVLALLIGLEFLPDGWSGKARTDSINAIRAFRNVNDPVKLDAMRKWLTADILRRVASVVGRLGPLEYELLKGHPSKKQVAILEAGGVVMSDSGYPYCIHNHRLDECLPGAWAEYEAELERLKQ